MPSSLHETLVEIVRRQPALIAGLLGDALGVHVPEHEKARLEPTDFTDPMPTEYRSDVVVVLSDGGGRDVLAVVAEAQLRIKPQKRWSWPVYVATLRSRTQCPTVLLVLCVDQATANWCATPIALGGPGSQLVPMVLGPDKIPLVTDAEEAARVPELAVLSAMAHGADPSRRAVLDALVGAFAVVDADHAFLYSEAVLTVLPAAAAHYLEALMLSPTYEPQSDFWQKRFAEAKAHILAEGRAAGRAAAVLDVLDARGIVVPDDDRSRIAGCADADLLDVWVRRAAVAGSVDDLFR